MTKHRARMLAAAALAALALAEGQAAAHHGRGSHRVPEAPAASTTSPEASVAPSERPGPPDHAPAFGRRCPKARRGEHGRCVRERARRRHRSPAPISSPSPTASPAPSGTPAV